MEGDGDDPIPSLAPQWLKQPVTSPGAGAGAAGDHHHHSLQHGASTSPFADWDSKHASRRSASSNSSGNFSEAGPAVGSRSLNERSWKSGSSGGGAVAPRHGFRDAGGGGSGPRDRGPGPHDRSLHTRPSLEDRFSSFPSPFDGSSNPSGSGGGSGSGAFGNGNTHGGSSGGSSTRNRGGPPPQRSLSEGLPPHSNGGGYGVGYGGRGGSGGRDEWEGGSRGQGRSGRDSVPLGVGRTGQGAAAGEKGGAGAAAKAPGSGFDRSDFPSLSSIRPAPPPTIPPTSLTPTTSAAGPFKTNFLAPRSSANWTSRLAEAPPTDTTAAATAATAPGAAAIASALVSPKAAVPVKAVAATSAAATSAGATSAATVAVPLASAVVSGPPVPRMADALQQAIANGSSSSATANAERSRLEQLAVRQSRQLIPVVVAAGGAKGKGGAASSALLQHKPPPAIAVSGPTMHKLEPKPLRLRRPEEGPLLSPTPLMRLGSAEASTGKGSGGTAPPSVTGISSTPVVLGPVPSGRTSNGSTGGADAAAAAAGSDGGTLPPGTSHPPLVTPTAAGDPQQLRERHSFFASLRRKNSGSNDGASNGAAAASNASVTSPDAAAPAHADVPAAGTASTTAPAVSSTAAAAAPAAPMIATRQSSLARDVAVLSAEEEEAFLRSLGWTQCDGTGSDEEDAGLTEEEIAAFQAAAQKRQAVAAAGGAAGAAAGGAAAGAAVAAAPMAIVAGRVGMNGCGSQLALGALIVGSYGSDISSSDSDVPL